ncbi:MAG: Abi family protein [Planctomycetes bacterium]|nr:Abi family protein [Planctomycetota bacterium]
MKYEKDPLTLEAQADKLIGRGLIAERDELMARLQAVNYYRLSGYLHPFRILDGDRKPTDAYQPGTTLDEVWRRYNFDRRLRGILLDAIERIEVAVRTRLVFHFVRQHGGFGYLDPVNLPGFDTVTEYMEWRTGLVEETRHARKDAFVEHFNKKYGDHHKELPLWMLCELMTFGSMLRFANAIEPGLQKAVADEYGMADEMFMAWLKAVYGVRNACAHHSRVWNRKFGAAPNTPHKNKFAHWHAAPKLPNDRVGYALAVCHYWLGLISKTSQWRQRLFSLFDEFPEVPLGEMGLPDTWRTHPLFRGDE